MSNKYPQITFVFDRRKTATPTTKGSLELRICYNYKQKYISTGIKLYSNQWKNGKITCCPDIIQISQTLDKLLTDVRQIILKMMEEGKVDIASIPEKLKAINTPKKTFLEFCHQRAEVRMYGKKADTQERYHRFLKRFSSWGGIKDFEDITDSNIIKYDRYLTNTGMKTCSRWFNYHRFLNSYIKDAIDAGYINRNPYRWLNIEKDKDSKGIERCLTPKEFERIRTCKLPIRSLERVRDIFVFQTYTCLSYSDLREFNINAIQKVKGMNVYIGKRKKTSKNFTIPLLPDALRILHKYSNKLPLISNVKYNKYLKDVAKIAGIDKPISTHWARHTGATLLLNDGVDMRIVSKICGHSSIKITEQVYAKLLDETVVEALQDVCI